ncbi:MAG: hypothetical protein ACI39G_02550 [Pseudoramibacter sp.]
MKMLWNNGLPRVKLIVTAGKKLLGMGPLSTSVIMSQNEVGEVYFNTLKDEYFYLVGYHWDGPAISTVTTTNTDHHQKAHTGRRHRILGAALGTLIMPGLGSAIGLAAGTGKKNKNNEHTTESTGTKQVEQMTTGTISVRNVQTQEKITFGFQCNSQLNIILKNFDWSHTQTVKKISTASMKSEEERIHLIREYKKLQEEGIISEEKFEEKKRELLG